MNSEGGRDIGSAEGEGRLGRKAKGILVLRKFGCRRVLEVSGVVSGAWEAGDRAIER